ncbi:MAG: Hsp20/alpha crystallin family protein [Candidatus Methanofastidiosum methylothiophilum]|uniref:Hsp20/alpha crystallin family protein n=1 Tax=Candidatus Methanofastidiosum methylothiophilum TaxID=1705564 RepID=A0A150JB23_9EURY|nr:MAG: Hsp20/alpha crystallin family protein [Candidatus Methanofastidiosum methylthiophilus]NMC77337.1 Hsp20/alpha crystallin family protein [Candidatus Methanofastidiosa archaeon]
MIRRYYVIRENKQNSTTEKYWYVNYCIPHSVEPLTEFHETNDALIANLDLPCVEKENIDVTSEEYCIRVCAPTTKGVCFKKEIRLPFPTDPENVSAVFRKGILVLEIPKKIRHFKIEIK